MCVWYLCVCRGSKYFKVVSDWLISDADLYGTILVGGPLRTQCDDVVVLAVVFFALLSRGMLFHSKINLTIFSTDCFKNVKVWGHYPPPVPLLTSLFSPESKFRVLKEYLKFFPKSASKFI